MLLALMLAAALDAPSPGKWMTHKVERGDTVARVAKRWGVSESDVRKWNPWVGTGDGQIKLGRVLQLRAASRPPMRMNAAYFASEGDTLGSLAERFGVSRGQIRAQLRGAELTADTRIVVPRPLGTSGWDPYAGREGELVELADPPYGGLSVGHPHDGHLLNGVPLPQTDLFDVWKPEWAFGSTHAVRCLIRGIAEFRRNTGWTGTLTVGSMSKSHGGPFKPHKSHQSGRDADIRLPRLDGSGAHPNHAQTDWHASWALISAFFETGEVEVVFLSRRLHGMLRAAAKDMDATPQELARIGTRIVHSKGHNAHLHIRFRCGVDETDCRSGG